MATSTTTAHSTAVPPTIIHTHKEAPGTSVWARPPKAPFLNKPLTVLMYLILLACLGVGSYGMYMRLMYGLTVTDLTSQVPWGAWVVFYVYFVGLSAGATILSSLVYAFRVRELEPIGRPSLAVGVISLGVGLAFIGMDLGSLIRSPFAMIFFHWTSPLSWAVRAYIVYIVLVGIQLFIAVRVQRGHFTNIVAIEWWQRLLSAITLPLAIIGVLGAEGSLFAVVKVRGMWAGGLFPVIFLASAILAATALMSFLYYAQCKGSGKPIDRNVMSLLSKILLTALLIDAGLTAYEYGIPLLSQNHHELEIINIVLSGPYAWTFWVLQVAMGLLIPILLLLSERIRNSPFMVATIGLIVLIGLIGVRFNIVLPPQIAPIIKGYPLNDYFPTTEEWLVSVFLIAAGVTAYTLVAQWQPVHDLSPYVLPGGKVLAGVGAPIQGVEAKAVDAADSQDGSSVEGTLADQDAAHSTGSEGDA